VYRTKNGSIEMSTGEVLSVPSSVCVAKSELRWHRRRDGRKPGHADPEHHAAHHGKQLVHQTASQGTR
jgi:hypothetical protein